MQFQLMQFIELNSNTKGNVVIYYQWTEFQHDHPIATLYSNVTPWNILSKKLRHHISAFSFFLFVSLNLDTSKHSDPKYKILVQKCW